MLIKSTIDFRPSELRLLVLSAEAGKLEAASHQFFDGDVNNVGEIFHSRRCKADTGSKQRLPCLVKDPNVEIIANQGEVA